jgi:hypothetical protein
MFFLTNYFQEFPIGSTMFPLHFPTSSCGFQIVFQDLFPIIFIAFSVYLTVKEIKKATSCKSIFCCSFFIVLSKIAKDYVSISFMACGI